MTVHNHAVVWVDHRVAKIFFLGLDAVDEKTIQPCDHPTDHEIIALGRHHFHLGEPAR
jgi:hypothetical protein